MQIYGVVNASPDSLADFSIATTGPDAKAYAEKLIADGADHIDLGGQASHGGATEVSPDTEWNILAEPLMAIVELGVKVSVDTWQVETARRAGLTLVGFARGGEGTLYHRSSDTPPAS